jgi:glycine cleavage system aminomethyltransferase T
MSVLEFLSVGAARDAGGFHPLARSSMERRQRDAGATFEERDGWVVPGSIPGEDEHARRVGIADLSHLAKFEVRPAPAEAVEGAGVITYRISRRRALVLCEPSVAAEVRGQLQGKVVLDMTAALSVLAVEGPQADTLLRRLTHVHHFPAGGDVAHITAHVLQPRPDAYWIVFPQEYGHYLWEVAVDRALPLGGGPIGVDALGATA